MHFSGIYEDEIVGRAYDRKLMGRFMGYLRPYRRLVVLTLVVLPLVAACRLAQPWLLKVAIDNHIVAGRMAGLPAIAALYLGLILAEALLTFVQVYLLQYLGQRIMADLRMELFGHVQRLSTRFFDRTPTGSLVTRLTSDVEALGEMFAAGIITIVGDILVLAGIIGIMLWMNLRLSLATFSVLPVLFWVAFTFRNRMRTAFRQVRARLANLNTFLAESISGMAIVQLFNRQQNEEQEFRRLNREYRDANLPVITWDASLFAGVEAISAVAVGLIIWYGGGEVTRGILSFGALVAFIQYIEKFFSPIRDLSAKYSVMQGAMAALERIFLLLDKEKDEVESFHVLPSPTREESAFNRNSTPETPPLFMGGGRGAGPFIQFERVWFAYQGEEYVLKDFSLQLNRGEKVALVGETGGGKTTVTRLLSRLYDINSGRITVDGTDIRTMSLTTLRRKIGVVLQDPYLFTGTIAYNITLGDPAATARLEQAVAVVGADRFIGRLANGLDEEVRERGVNFSAGERQLISFARAVAFDPEILILDEATASVDTEAERLIESGLKGLLAGRTSLVVAHRLSTIKDADRIVTIHRGEKMEEGSHPDLIAAQGLYYRLYQLQFKD